MYYLLHAMQVLVLFALSWRLGPILAAVIVSTAATAALYRIQTKNAEQSASETNQAMVSIAGQTFDSITTVRWGHVVMLEGAVLLHNCVQRGVRSIWCSSCK